MNKANIVDWCLLGVSTLYSIDNIRSILGLIILGINCLWLLVKFIVKLVDIIKKKGSLSELDGDVNNIKDAIGEIIDKLDDKEDTDATESDKQE